MDSVHRTLTVNAPEAVAASVRGDDTTAIWMMRWIVKYYPHFARFFATHSEPSVRFNFQRARQRDARGAEIFKPCPILGSPNPELSRRQRTIVEGILKANWDEWERGETVMPSRVNVFSDYADTDISKLKVVVLFQQFHRGDPELLENVCYFYILGSAVGAGLNAVGYPGDSILYDGEHIKRPMSPEIIAASLAEFDRFLDRERPDIVVADGNFPPTVNTITPAFWAAAQAKYGFKLVVMIPDGYDMAGDGMFTPYWKNQADLVVLFHMPSRQLVDVENAVVLPSMPIDESLLHPFAPKYFGVKFVGSDTRNRLDWLTALATFNNQVFAKAGTLGGPRMKTMRDYCVEIAGIRITFNNGRIDNNTDAITLRVGETILTRTVLMQEDNSAIRQYLVPFVHYIPLANVTQFICFAQFFLESDEWYERITEAARSFWHEHYSSELTWRFICGRVLDETPTSPEPATATA